MSEAAIQTRFVQTDTGTFRHVLYGEGFHCERCDSDSRCFICNSDFTICTVCRGAEIDLPTDCPGRVMTTDEMDAIAARRLDFIDGRWQRRCPS